jgi:hypothetical protein
MTKERFQEVLEEMRDLHDRKNKDYAGEDYLSNLKMCEAMDIPAWKGVVIRMTDKMARLMNLTRSNDPVVKESVKNAFLDMGVYSGMGLVAYENSLGEGANEDIGTRKTRKQTQRRRKKTVIQTVEGQIEDAVNQAS